MSKAEIIRKLEADQLKKDIPRFDVGDTVTVHTRIIEGNKERVQAFTGTVIARKGTGAAETFALHRVAYGEGMERIFLLHSPRISRIELIKEGQVRRSKLYNLRGTTGKKAKVKGRITSRHKKLDAIEQKRAAEESKPVEKVSAEPQETAASQE